METFLGWGFILFIILWYLTSKQKKRDREKNEQLKRQKILTDIKQELYQYALANEKIGKNKWIDIEGEGGYYPYVDNEKDKKKVYDLVDKYEKNILNDKYTDLIRVYRPLGSSYTIPNQLEYIIPFLKSEIDKLPKGKDDYYSFENH